MTTVHRRCDGRYLVVCKGAPENVLAAPLVDADAAELAALTAAAHRAGRRGLRVLAVAAAVVDAAARPGRADRAAPLGLVGIGDPLRAGAAGHRRRASTPPASG